MEPRHRQPPDRFAHAPVAKCLKLRHLLGDP